MSTSTLRIGVLMPEVLGTYGDSGNALILAERARRRGIDAEVVHVGLTEEIPDSLDIYTLGGREDTAQALAADKFRGTSGLARALDAGRPLLVCATHLAPNSALNSRQLAWLERRLPRIARRRGIRGAPILVLGDLNMDVEKVRRESGLGVLAEGLTYPEDAPDAQIDHVLGWGMVPGGEASIVHLPVSDHAGLVADVEFE